MSVYIKEISGNECIGNSLSTINANFIALDNNLINLTNEFNNSQIELPAIATTTSVGVVRVGQGLTITNEGILSSNTQYTFTNGLLSSAGHIISINVDNNTVMINGEGYLEAIPTQQDAWVMSNSSTLNTLISNTTRQINTLSSTSTSTANAIRTLSSEYNSNMNVTLNAVNSLVNLLSAKISTHPVGGIANEPNPYVLTISASPVNVDFLPLTYRWYYNSQLLTTNLRTLSTYNEGRYYCICTNAISQTRSNEVLVSFNRRVDFLDQPDSQQYSGSDITLMVAVSGTQPRTYQWVRNNVAIPNTNNLFHITNITGDYYCIASNMVNSVTSDVAVIS